MCDLSLMINFILKQHAHVYSCLFFAVYYLISRKISKSALLLYYEGIQVVLKGIKSPCTLIPSSETGSSSKFIDIPQNSIKLVLEHSLASSVSALVNPVTDVIQFPRKSSRPKHFPKYLEVHRLDLPSTLHHVTVHPITNFLSSYARHLHIKPLLPAYVKCMNLIHMTKLLNSHAIGCKWVFKVAMNADDTVQRYKARLVAKGYNQVEGFDYQETFSPVAKQTAVRLDISNEFLNGDLDEVVYMDLPEGYSIKGEYPLGSKMLRDLGTMKYLLGLKIAKGPKGISICQKKYTLDLLDEYGMLGTKPVTTLIDYSHKLSKAVDGKEVDNPTRYRQLVGKLLCLTFTRPDISYAVQVLSLFMEKPKQEHMSAAYGLLKYLKLAPGQGIFMKADSYLSILAYSDSDWVGCGDTRKSVTGYCVSLGDSLVNWKSKK
ncbi:Reverse transcriptase [Theobroma cacao]|nr:Reverse transcriptase [Theobroma cacao]